jgi:hypothetical protein
VPANLPPQYYAAKKRLEASSDMEEQIEILTEMQRIMPKHKGTDKLRAEIRSRLANLKKTAQKQSVRHKRHDNYYVEKQGAAQIALIGFPNVGKSNIVSALTNADTQVADYPFTTVSPIVGMMPFKDISMQLIDTPPISADFMEKSLPELIRRADLALLVVDIGSDEALDQVDTVISRLAEARIKLTSDEIRYDDEFTYKRAIILANKQDREGSQERLDILKEFYSQRFPIITISAETEYGLDEMKKKIFETLDIIRVYTKAVGKKADMKDPIILRSGSTVIDAAAEIHNEFYEGLQFARVWGDGQIKYDGQRVSRDHPLEDGNIVEFHIPEESLRV